MAIAYYFVIGVVVAGVLAWFDYRRSRTSHPSPASSLGPCPEQTAFFRFCFELLEVSVEGKPLCLASFRDQTGFNVKVFHPSSEANVIHVASGPDFEDIPGFLLLQIHFPFRRFARDHVFVDRSLVGGLPEQTFLSEDDFRSSFAAVLGDLRTFHPGHILPAA